MLRGSFSKVTGVCQKKGICIRMGSLIVFVGADKELQVLKPYPYVTTPSKCFCSCLKWI